MKNIVIPTFALFVMFLGQNALSQDATAIMKACWDAFIPARDYVYQEVTSQNYTSGKAEGNLKKFFVMVRLNKESGKHDIVIRFQEPAAERSLGFLINCRLDGDNLQYLREPLWTRARKFAVSNQGRQFSDSLFSYEDTLRFAYFQVGKWNYELLDIEDGYTKIKSTPKVQSNSSYGTIIFWVKDNKCCKIEFYDQGGNLFKTQKNEQIQDLPAGCWRANQITMEDGKGNSTILTVTCRDFPPSISNYYFSSNYLADDSLIVQGVKCKEVTR